MSELISKRKKIKEIKSNIKPKKSQTKYHRAISESEDSSSDDSSSEISEDELPPQIVKMLKEKKKTSRRDVELEKKKFEEEKLLFEESEKKRNKLEEKLKSQNINKYINNQNEYKKFNSKPVEFKQKYISKESSDSSELSSSGSDNDSDSSSSSGFPSPRTPKRRDDYPKEKIKDRNYAKFYNKLKDVQREVLEKEIKNRK